MIKSKYKHPFESLAYNKGVSEEQKRILDIIKEESNSRLDCIRKIKGESE